MREKSCDSIWQPEKSFIKFSNKHCFCHRCKCLFCKLHNIHVENKNDQNKWGVLISMILFTPCDLPIVPLLAEKHPWFSGYHCKNVTNGTIGKFSDFTIDRTPNIPPVIQNIHWSVTSKFMTIWTTSNCMWLFVLD